MSSLESALARWRPRELDLVVHVGAGRGDELDAYAALEVGRAVLVDGDAQAAAELRDAVARLPWAEVLERVVSADGADAEWNRYNLAALNGLADALDARRIFPRLRRESSLRIPTTKLDALLAAIEVPDGGRSALVLDMHGIDARLLDLAREQLHRFEGIVLRGTVRSADGGDGSIDLQLRAAGFVPELPGDDDALWPVQRWRFDRPAFERGELRRRLEASEAAVRAGREELSAVRADLTAQLDAARRSAHDAQAAFSREREVQSQRAERLDADVLQAEQRCRTLETQLQLQQDEHASARQRAQEQLAQAQEAGARADRERGGLAAAVSEHLARIETMSARLVDAEREAASRLEQLDEWRRQAADQEQRRKESQAQFDQERAELAAAASSHVSRIEALSAALAQAERQAQEFQARFELERAELASVASRQEARIDALVAALSEAERQAAARASDVEALRGQRTEQDLHGQESQARFDRERAELAAAASAHQARTDALSATLSQTQAKATAHVEEVDQLRRQAAEQDKRLRDLEQVLQDRQARINGYVEKLTTLEREREAALKRERLLRDELLQAEAQIELVKDVVLRESEL